MYRVGQKSLLPIHGEHKTPHHPHDMMRPALNAPHVIGPYFFEVLVNLALGLYLNMLLLQKWFIPKLGEIRIKGLFSTKWFIFNKVYFQQSEVYFQQDGASPAHYAFIVAYEVI